jgi:hypothetical protein
MMGRGMGRSALQIIPLPIIALPLGCSDLEGHSRKLAEILGQRSLSKGCLANLV